MRTLVAPSGAVGVKAGRRLTISWQPDFAAKQYEVQISHTDGFARLVEVHRTDNTSWAPQIDLSSRLGKGALYWRLAAVDGIGNVGSYTSGRFGAAPKPCPHAVRGHRSRHPVPSCARSHKKKKKKKH